MSSAPIDSVKGGAINVANSGVDTAIGLWSQFVGYLGNAVEWLTPVLAVLAILIIGGFIVRKLMKLLKIALEKAKVDTILEKVGLTGELQSLGVNVTASSLITGIIGLITKFILWMAAINVLGIEALTNLMNDILTFIPNIVIAIILLFAGLTIAKMVKDLIEKSASSLSVEVKTATLFGKISKVAILTLTILAVLNQLNIATDLVNTLFQGVVYGLTIAGGIAFGLGGQEKAKEILEKIGK